MKYFLRLGAAVHSRMRAATKLELDPAGDGVFRMLCSLFTGMCEHLRKVPWAGTKYFAVTRPSSVYYEWSPAESFSLAVGQAVQEELVAGRRITRITPC